MKIQLAACLVNVVSPSALRLNPPSASVDDLDLVLTVHNIVLVLDIQMRCFDGVDDVWAPRLFFLPQSDRIISTFDVVLTTCRDHWMTMLLWHPRGWCHCSQVMS